MDEIERHVLEAIRNKNKQPIVDFEGYSPAEMQVILYNFFTPTCVVQLRRLSTDDYLKIPLLNQIKFLYHIIKENGGLKLTKKGNLPTKIVAEIYKQGYLKDDFIESGISKLYKEEQVQTIVLTRILLELSNLVKKRNNILSATKKGNELMNNNYLLFQHLLEIFSSKFNWGYFDGYENEEIGQIGFGFTLLLLNKYGKKKRNTYFYAKKYIKAFGFKNKPDSDFSDDLSSAYSLRTFDRFLDYLGLIELDNRSFGEIQHVKTTKLFEKLIEIRPHSKNYAMGNLGNIIV